MKRLVLLFLLVVLFIPTLLPYEYGEEVAFLSLCVNADAWSPDGQPISQDHFIPEGEAVAAAVKKRWGNIGTRIVHGNSAHRGGCIAGLKWIGELPSNHTRKLIYINGHGNLNGGPWQFRTFDGVVDSLEIRSLLRGSSRITIFLDSCHAEGLIRDFHDGPAILGSCSIREGSHPWVFTRPLVEGLRSAGDPIEYVLTHIKGQTPIYFPGKVR